MIQNKTDFCLKVNRFKGNFDLFLKNRKSLQKLEPFISLIIQRCSMVKQTIWQSNRASHTKFYFNEFVANVLRDNIGTVIFDL